MTYARHCIIHLQVKLSYQNYNIFTETVSMINRRNSNNERKIQLQSIERKLLLPGRNSNPSIKRLAKSKINKICSSITPCKIQSARFPANK